MGARPDTWMPLYIGDYLADTMHLNHAQHGIYMLLIMAYWRNGGPLQDASNELAATARCTLEEWEKNREIIARFFRIKGGLWRHKRIDAELRGAEAHTKARRKAARIGAKARWDTRCESHANGNADAMPSDAPSPSPSPSSPSLRSVEERSPPASVPPQPETMHHASMLDASPQVVPIVEKPHVRRGTRLPADWQPGWEDCEFAAALGLDPGEVADEFADYWRSVSGAKAFKLDWSATFRNQCRRTRRKPAFAGNNGSEGPSITAILSRVRLAGDD